jgi:hypothetical protein
MIPQISITLLILCLFNYLKNKINKQIIYVLDGPIGAGKSTTLSNITDK